MFNYFFNIKHTYFRQGTYVLTSNSTLICFTFQDKLENEIRIIPSNGNVYGKFVNFA